MLFQMQRVEQMGERNGKIHNLFKWIGWYIIAIFVIPTIIIIQKLKDKK